MCHPQQGTRCRLDTKSGAGRSARAKGKSLNEFVADAAERAARDAVL
ncbi:type II toxin -antitoxin system TacA 1-like antitoxin [Solidesulfovibrio sp.]